MFVGRKEELKELKEMLESNSFKAALIYGKRRVGKTEIITQALKETDKIVCSFECKKTNLDLNLQTLSEYFLNLFNLPNIVFKDFDSFFDFVFRYSLEKEFVFVIDEFSFLLEEDFSIESSLAIAIDKYKNESKMKLIISGSYVQLIEKMIDSTSHCYGRFTNILLIRPFDYYESSLFYPNYSDEDKFICYSVFGGLAYFNSLINDSKSVEDNICSLIIKKDSILEAELNQMILLETTKINRLNDLILLIARGKTKYADILSVLSQEKLTKPDYLLKKLIEMDIIEKVVPINKKENKKLTFYQFKDNFFSFYYKYIFASPYSLIRGNPKMFFDNFIKDDFYKNFLPKSFEKVSKEFLLRENLKGKIKPIFKDIGTYFYDDSKNKVNRQFDVVSLDENGYISYECKFTSEKVNKKVIEEELSQSKSLEIPFYRLGFISKNGFSNDFDKKDFNLFELKDFYKE